MNSIFEGVFSIVKNVLSSPKISKTEIEIAQEWTGESFHLFIVSPYLYTSDGKLRFVRICKNTLHRNECSIRMKQ